MKLVDLQVYQLSKMFGISYDLFLSILIEHGLNETNKIIQYNKILTECRNYAKCLNS